MMKSSELMIILLEEMSDGMDTNNDSLVVELVA